MKNKKPEKTKVEVEKKWYNEDGSPIENDNLSPVKVQLYRSTKTASGGGGTTPEPPGSSATVPINFTTQFFKEGDNGSNNDSSSIAKGDYTYSTTVTSGGKLEFELDVDKVGGSANAAIYSVTANGKTLTPVNGSITKYCSQNCCIAGTWGNYPPRNGKYVIDPVKNGTDIKITLIGYLQYGGNPWHPDVSYTMNPIKVSTYEPSGTGGSGSSGGSSQPGGSSSGFNTKPDDAEKVGSIITLSAGNSWKDGWSNLETKDPNGKPYYYYVEEISNLGGFSTSYDGNGVLNGVITINNVRIRTIEVVKKWLNVDGTEMNTKPDIEISAVLIQNDLTDHTNREIPFKLNKSNKWHRTWKRGSAELGEKKNHKYEYRIREISQIEGYSISYSNSEGIGEGEIVIKNQQKRYELPSAGGIGTYLFYFIGAVLITLAALMYWQNHVSILARRRKER